MGLTILLLLLLTVVLGGLVRMVAKTVFGPKPDVVAKGELGLLTTLPMIILIALMLLMGTHIPKPVSELLENAANIVMNIDESGSPNYTWPTTLISNPSISVQEK